MTLPRTAIVYLATTCLAIACAPGTSPTSEVASSSNFTNLPPSRPTPLNPFLLARLPTYDRSMQAVHPDVIHFDGAWNGWEYWMAFTPFPGGNVAFENPSIAVSHNGVNWHVPQGLTNPLVSAPAVGYNSDPDLSFDAGRDELVLIYRTVSGGYNHINEMRSTDGVHWGASRPIFRRKNHGMVSPSVVINPDGGARIWYVDASSNSCQHRVTQVKTQVAQSTLALREPGMERGWSSPRRVSMNQPGYSIWHLDVEWIPELQEYWAVYSAYAGTDCTTQELFFARSTDGEHWQTYPIPFLRHGEMPWTSGTMYRASVMYDAEHQAIRFYTSSMMPVQVWRIGVVEYRLSTFLMALSYGIASTPMRMGTGPGSAGDIEP